WRGDHVTVKQLAEDFARYFYLPRLRNSKVLVEAAQDGVALLSWQQDSFAYADSFDEVANRYRGLRFGQHVTVSEDDLNGVLVKPDAAQKQFQAEQAATAVAIGGTQVITPPGIGSQVAVGNPTVTTQASTKPKRFYGSVKLNPQRVGRDAG